MNDLIQQYEDQVKKIRRYHNKLARELKQLDPEEDIVIYMDTVKRQMNLSWMESNLQYSIFYMKNGFTPGIHRGVYKVRS